MDGNNYFDPSRLDIDEQEAQEAFDAFCIEFFDILDVMYCSEDRVL